MTDLSTLDGWGSSATALNDRGQVVGINYLDVGRQHGFVWQRGVMTDLGTLGGGQSTYVSDINNRGQIVGWSQTATGDQQAFLWDHGVMTDLGTFGGADSDAARIDDRGDIVGEAEQRAVTTTRSCGGMAP